MSTNIAGRHVTGVTTSDPENVRDYCPHCCALFSMSQSVWLRNLIADRFQCDVCHMRGRSFSKPAPQTYIDLEDI